jgi:hypothetical protein
MSLCGDRHLPTLKEVSAPTAFRMRELLIGRQSEAHLHLRQIKQCVVLSSHHPPDGCGDQIHDDPSIAIEPIKTNEGLAWQKTQRGLVRNDHAESWQQLASIVSIARPPTRPQPLMRMGEHSRGAGAYHLCALSTRVPRRTDGKQAPVWGRQIRALLQSTLSRCLSGAIEIEDLPVFPLPIPQTSYDLGRSWVSQRILQEYRAQRFYAVRVEGGKKATECRTMGQLAPSSPSHEWSGKRVQARVLRPERRFEASCVADQHDQKVDHLKSAEPFAGEANLLGECGK